MTTRDALTCEAFEAALDGRGADLSRWPTAEAHAAERLLDASAEARARFAAARRLDAAVAEAAEATPAPGLALRLNAALDGRRRARERWLADSPGRFGLAGAGFGAAAVAVGLWLGAVVGPVDAATPDFGAAFEVSLIDGGL